MQKILKVLLAVLGLLLLIPLASAQEESEPLTLTLAEDTRFEDLFAEYGCPVGIRDANRQLELNDAGLIVAGQTVIVPSASPLCALDYTGEIKFFSMGAFEREERNAGTYRTFLPMSELAAAQNVCEATLREFNPEWVASWQTGAINDEWFYLEPDNAGTVPSYVRIPLDTPACFQTVELAAGQRPRDLATSLNICEQEIWYFNPESIYTPSSESRNVYIPLDYMPCFHDGRQQQMRQYLGYPNQWGDYVDVEVVNMLGAGQVIDFAVANHYCENELQASNNHARLEPLLVGDPIYVPAGTPRCDYVTEESKNLVEISREYNVCLETIINANRGLDSWITIGKSNSDGGSGGGGGGYIYTGIFVPTGNPPCYDENGLRIGHNDRAVHESSKDEWVFGIAQQYQVCIADLVAANPLMNSYPQYELPSLIFIPDVPPCSDVAEDGFVHYQVRPDDSLNASELIQDLSYIYNVCPSFMIEANPNLVVREDSEYQRGWYLVENISHEQISYWLEDMQVGDSLLIPANTPPCYDFYAPLAGMANYYNQSMPGQPVQIDYVCYAQEVNPNEDYSGHEPAIAPIAYEVGAHCYDRLSDPRIVLDNVTYTLYPWLGDIYPYELANCLGANGNEMFVLEAEALGLKSDYPYSDRFWAVPNAGQDCPLVGNDRAAATTWKRTFREHAVLGQMDENGNYWVTYGDTLYDIGRRYGYLPEWIMAENNLSDDWVYPYQSLRMPGYPNIYQLATYAAAGLGGLLVFVGASFALRWRGSGRKAKKKNDE